MPTNELRSRRPPVGVLVLLVPKMSSATSELGIFVQVVSASRAF
jgi:hypothetical protein